MAKFTGTSGNDTLTGTNDRDTLRGNRGLARVQHRLLHIHENVPGVMSEISGDRSRMTPWASRMPGLSDPTGPYRRSFMPYLAGCLA